MSIRILHTADWHVGRTIARRSRLDEHRAVLAEIAEIAAHRHVDVAIVAGDVFDQQNPSADAERVVYRALADLRDAVPHVVVVAGNHDSPRRWEALAHLAGDVHIVAHPASDPADAIVDVTGADGSRARVLCLPWVSELRALADADSEDIPVPLRPSVAAWVRDHLAELVASAHGDGVQLIGAAHLMVTSAALGGGERPLTVNDVHSVPVDVFSDRLAYVALGHVHRAQRVGATGQVRYAGSLLQLDFADQESPGRVVLAEIDRGGTRVEEVPLTAGMRLVRLEGTLPQIEQRAAEERIPAAHLQVILHCDGPEPGLGDRVRELVPGCVEVRLEHERSVVGAPEVSLAGLSPRDLFARYLTDRAGFAAADPALLDRFEALLADADEDEAADGDQMADRAA